MGVCAEQATILGASGFTNGLIVSSRFGSLTGMISHRGSTRPKRPEYFFFCCSNPTLPPNSASSSTSSTVVGSCHQSYHPEASKPCPYSSPGPPLAQIQTRQRGALLAFSVDGEGIAERWDRVGSGRYMSIAGLEPNRLNCLGCFGHSALRSKLGACKVSASL
jgi:hypothetical protein